jgi:hypothetical protein
VPRPPRVRRVRRPSRIIVPGGLRSHLAAGIAVATFVLGVLVGIGTMLGRGGQSGSVLASVAAGDRPTSIATDGRTAWVADAGSGRVIAFDIGTLATEWAVSVGPRPTAISYGLGALWVVDAGDQQLRELSPVDGHLIGQANTSLDPVGLATTDRVWVLAPGNATADGYDPQTLQQDRSALNVPQATAVVGDSGGLWVVSGGQLHRIPDAGGDGAVVDLGAAIDLIAEGTDTLWAASADRELIAVDPTTGGVLARIALPGKATAIAAGPTGVGVATDDGSVTWVDQPGAAPVELSRTGTILTSAAIAGHQLVGTSPDTGLLYRMEITP